MKLQQRDRELLIAVGAYGCLTAQQIRDLFFSSLKTCQRRTRLLVKEKYLGAMPLPTTGQGRSPYLFYLGLEGGLLVGIAPSRPRPNTTQSRHERQNASLLIATHLAAKEVPIGCRVLPEHMIRAKNQAIVPDGAFLLSRDGKHALFLLENCSGTEPLRSAVHSEDLEGKVARYVTAYAENSVGFYEDYFDVDQDRFRVLFVAAGQRRLSGIMELARERDPHGFIWGTTLRQFTKKESAFGAIWCTPKEGRLSIT